MVVLGDGAGVAAQCVVIFSALSCIRPLLMMLIDPPKRTGILPTSIVGCDAWRRDRGKRCDDQATICLWPNDLAAASSGRCNVPTPWRWPADRG